MAEEDTHESLSDYPLDRAYTTECSERRTVASYADLSYDEYQPQGYARNRSTGASEASMDRSYAHGDGWHAGHTEWDHRIDEAPQEHDGRADTRTGFDPRDASDPDKYRRLVPWQEGQWDTTRRARNQEADCNRWVSMFSSAMGLSPHQKKRCGAIMDGFNMKFAGTYKTETVVLAAISIVANEDNRWIRDENEYKELLRDVGATLKDIRKCRQLVKKHSDVL